MRIHNHRFGMYEVNKHSITTFPFSYTPFQGECVFGRE